MGKKSSIAEPQTITPLKESLRKSSNLLEKHIFNKNSMKLRPIINKQLLNNQIEINTFRAFEDASQKAKNVDSDEQSENGANLNNQNDYKFRILNQVETKKCYSISSTVFKKSTLRQRFGYLINSAIQRQENTRIISETISQEQKQSLQKIKKLYKKYRVSNMFKVNLCAKIKKVHVDTLQRKGYLREYDHSKSGVILTLVC